MKQEKLTELCKKIQGMQKAKVVIAIDGKCASGKTTLAEALSKQLHANVFHMDDYFLRVEQRTKQRYREPGGNVDRERFYQEIGTKLHTDSPIIYAPFDCQKMEICENITVQQTPITIVEGSYAMHPDLQKLYDLSIFLDISEVLQLQRIEIRNPDKVEMFQKKWIPLENQYFGAFGIKQHCDIILRAEEMW